MSVCIRAVSTRMPRITRSRSAGRSARAAFEQLCVGRHRAHGRAQLVRRVGDELAELLLGLRAPGERVLDVAQA